MKKLFVVLIALVTILAVSCGKGSKKVETPSTDSTTVVVDTAKVAVDTANVVM